MSDTPLRLGQIWHADFGTPVGHEAGFARPVLVISADRFNAHELVTVCPITRTEKPYPTRIRIPADDISGLSKTSYAQVEQVRTVSTQRLTKQYGMIQPDSVRDVQRVLKLLFDLRP
jgi:mRNA interferase MazF